MEVEQRWWLTFGLRIDAVPGSTDVGRGLTLEKCAG
jgi:hypothetical protein